MSGQVGRAASHGQDVVMPSQVGTEDRGSEVLPGRALRYRPYLDGLRTVAVYLVVAFHAGLGLFSGGFIGVDIFFVLSGFLVTRILMRDLASLGRIRWRQFYSRRVRRILPAALVALVVTALVYSIVASPAEMLDALGGFRAAFFYVANWFFIHQSTDYFAANVNSNPVLHFWSLAVEEQFYLVWPLLLGGLYVATRRAGRRRWWVVRAVVVVAAAASASAALHLGSTNIDRAYYGTDTRAYELLAGAVLALTPQLLRLGPRSRTLARWISVLTLGGLLVLATSVFDMSPITRGVLVAGLAPVLIIALENARRDSPEAYLSSSAVHLPRADLLRHLSLALAGHRHRRARPRPEPGRDVRDLRNDRDRVSPRSASTSSSTRSAPRARSTGSRRRSSRSDSRRASSSARSRCRPFSTPAPARSPRRGASQSRSGLRLLDWRVAKNDIPDLPDCLGAPVSHCTVAKGNGKRVLSSATAMRACGSRPSPRSRNSGAGTSRSPRIRPALAAKPRDPVQDHRHLSSATRRLVSPRHPAARSRHRPPCAPGVRRSGLPARLRAAGRSPGSTPRSRLRVHAHRRVLGVTASAAATRP